MEEVLFVAGSTITAIRLGKRGAKLTRLVQSPRFKVSVVGRGLTPKQCFPCDCLLDQPNSESRMCKRVGKHKA